MFFTSKFDKRPGYIIVPCFVLPELSTVTFLLPYRLNCQIFEKIFSVTDGQQLKITLRVAFCNNRIL